MAYRHQIVKIYSFHKNMVCNHHSLIRSSLIDGGVEEKLRLSNQIFILNDL